MKPLLRHSLILFAAAGLTWILWNLVACALGLQPDWTGILAF